MIKKLITLLSIAFLLAFISSDFFYSSKVNAKEISNVSGAAFNNSTISPNIKLNNKTPNNFDPLAATNSQLKKYGFPKRPTDKKGLSQWESVMKHAKHNITSKLTSEPAITPDAIIGGGGVGTLYSNNWTGYITKSSLNGGVSYSEVNAEMNVPKDPYVGTSDADPCFWVGLGGWNTSNLIQAGFDVAALNQDAGLADTQYEFWIEDYTYPYPSNYNYKPRYKTSPSIKATDEVYVDVIYDQSSKSTTFFLEDITQDSFQSYTMSTPYYDGSTADFICEATGPVYKNFYFTPACTFKFCQLSYDNGMYEGELGEYGYNSIDMTTTGNSSGTRIAYPSSVSNGDQFSIYPTQ